MLVRALRWLLVLALLSGCGTSAGGFIGTRTLNRCEGSYPVCNSAAGCVLDESQYTEGTLPGERRVIFRTDGPARVRVRLLFIEERSPGKSTLIEWNELGCSSQKVFSFMGRDIFQIAGESQQLSVEQPLQTRGDHLIRLISDATARYQMRIEIAR
ncbi:MAG: hypothetical protein RMK29_11490 [Myxococcales bacterium]|nr:hypothetical protein [Myxococcota bacterium]MDW8282331.1 hypothetical protein [Myxococcales bacterium]